MALARGGVAIDEPLAWFDSLSDETVEFWSAYWRLEPWGCEWERHAQAMSMADVQYAATVNPHLKPHDRVKPRPPREFMPADYYMPKTKKKKPSRDELIKQLDRFAGRSR